MYSTAPFRNRILLGKQEFLGRPGETLPPTDMAAARERVAAMLGREPSGQEVISWVLYERVYEEFAAHQDSYSDVSILPTPHFFFGLEPGEEIAVDIEPGKTLIIRLQTVSDPHADGTRTVFFELNGQPRRIKVPDRAHGASGSAVRRKAETGNTAQLGAPMPGVISQVSVSAGQTVKSGDVLLSIEAMKMETALHADRDGTISEVLVRIGDQIDAKDLLIVYSA